MVLPVLSLAFAVAVGELCVHLLPRYSIDCVCSQFTHVLLGLHALARVQGVKAEQNIGKLRAHAIDAMKGEQINTQLSYCDRKCQLNTGSTTQPNTPR